MVKQTLDMSQDELIEEVNLLRHLVSLLWPFVRMWPLSGVGGDAMDAHELMANYLGDVDAAKVTAARDEGFDDASGRMADWIEERWLRRMAPDAREDFINEIRGGQWAGGNDEH